MSLVERALQKLRESGPAKSPSAPKPDVRARSTPTAPPVPMRDEPPAAPIQLNREALHELNLLPPPDREREISSQYQQIKRALVASLNSETSGLKNNPTIMIASALPGEGKTFVSINLALRLAAEKDYEVLLVDGDVLKPHISRIFKIEDRPGLMDLLTDRQRPVSSVVIPTDIPSLNILPAGKRGENPTELLASQRMHEVIGMLQHPDRRRIVVFDSPPMLLATEANAMIPAVGQVILVVRSDMTPRHAVLDALTAIGDTRPVSLILNQVHTHGAPGYYNYGYAYGTAGNQ